MPTLEFSRGETVLFSHRLRTRTRLGRRDDADIALPDRQISRRHCELYVSSGRWWLSSQGKHGTRVNGVWVRSPVELSDGDVVALGPYTARFFVAESGVESSETQLCPQPHVELPQGARGSALLERAHLSFTSGPRAGEHVPLRRMLTTLGGASTHVSLPGLQGLVAAITVARGRPMIQPESTEPVYLGRERVVMMTPVYEGEEVHIAGHSFTLHARGREDAQPSRSGMSFGSMLGSSRQMRRLFGALYRCAASEHPVLVLGESGTGKELASVGLHAHSARRDGPFISVNCASLGTELFEAQLFGYEKGAFTGADQRTDGLFHHAHGGTLFLDEIGELSPCVQAKLLRVLETRGVQRVGSPRDEAVDVRIVAATHRNLSERVREGSFRHDLLFRLDVLRVQIPPLRERVEDIEGLAQSFLSTFRGAPRLTSGALTRLETHPWPGNVRELRNVLSRAVVGAMPRTLLEADDLEFEGGGRLWQSRKQIAMETERALLLRALERAGGNRTRAAKTLGIPRTTLNSRLAKLDLSLS